jgi:hypothetical protein
LRKQPLQDRSRAAVARVLDVAAKLAVDVGAGHVAESVPLLLDAPYGA